MPRQQTALIAFVLVILALSLRLPSLGSSLTPDERLWSQRTTQFMQALDRHDWTGTLTSGHPGVTVMWAGTAGVVLKALVDPPADAGSLPQLVSALSQKPSRVDLIPSLRLPIALITLAGILVITLLARQLLGGPAAGLPGGCVDVLRPVSPGAQPGSADGCPPGYFCDNRLASLAGGNPDQTPPLSHPLRHSGRSGLSHQGFRAGPGPTRVGLEFLAALAQPTCTPASSSAWINVSGQPRRHVVDRPTRPAGRWAGLAGSLDSASRYTSARVEIRHGDRRRRPRAGQFLVGQAGGQPWRARLPRRAALAYHCDQPDRATARGPCADLVRLAKSALQGASYTNPANSFRARVDPARITQVRNAKQPGHCSASSFGSPL